MEYFTSQEFNTRYPSLATAYESWQIEASCEMIYSQLGVRYRNNTWDSDTVPDVIKKASMEQLRYMIEQDIPFVDYKGTLKAGEMEAQLKSDYSTLALRYLANGGYLYRGNNMTNNMAINVNWRE